MFEQFASDNYAGICSEVMEYLARANAGYAKAYGEDDWTQRAADLFREIFETDCEVFFVFNGTAANSLALGTLCRSYHSIICHELAHVETDECGAPERFTHGAKMLVGQGPQAKLSPASIESLVTKRCDLHYPKPKAVSLTQATELGTLYSIEELQAIREVCDRYQLRLHMDGARFANAVAAMKVCPAEITWRSGVDVLCFGGTKNGTAIGEAILFFDRALAEDFEYHCKQAGQLASKMRYVSAQMLGLLETGAWLNNAAHANRCAAYLETQLADFPELRFIAPRQANGVFIDMPPLLIEALREKGWHFYTFIGEGGARLMCAWNSTFERIDEFVQDVKTEMARLQVS
ncbi:MAG: low specificity L-threonine aldolase [Leptolyngbya sp. SIO4C1]|nr:low specificity L-threonine aldolase [Leptolyngbya sp. SIO4C1]